MKKTIFLAAIAFAAGIFSGSAAADDFAPTSTWPYVYKDFSNGSVIRKSAPEKPGLFNISVIDGSLHFIDGPLVKAANVFDVLGVRIGEDYFVNNGGKMYRVLAKSDKSLVVEAKEVDYATLNSTGGAYGSSSNTLGTMALSSAEGFGRGNSEGTNHVEMMRGKDEGKILPLIPATYILVGSNLILARKGDVEDSEIAPKSDLKAFFKENKIKWKEPSSLLLLGDFLSKYSK